MNFWLMKSEPSDFSIDKLAKVRSSLWTGVRNYQARNFMMQKMAVKDAVLFYHSNANPSGVAGLARVAALAKPDPTQFEKHSDYHDAKSTRENPRWWCVEIEFVEKFAQVLSLETIKADNFLSGMELLKRGNRLSIQPVDKKHFDHIAKLARA
jgi:predicted RNA-binding protein with PUA-like domain